MKSIKKSFTIIVIVQGLIFSACGGGGTSEKQTPQVETLAQTENLDVNDTLDIGSIVGKVTIPSVSEDIQKVELIGDESEKFTISKDGTIRTKRELRKSKSSLVITEKLLTTKVPYIFQVKVTYTSGKIIFINIKIVVYSYREVSDENNTADYFIAIDNAVHDINKSFMGYNVVVYADKQIAQAPSNSTKAIYGNINGVRTDALLAINSNYENGTAFIVKVFKENRLVGESEKSILSGNTLEFSDIQIK